MEIGMEIGNPGPGKKTQSWVRMRIEAQFTDTPPMTPSTMILWARRIVPIWMEIIPKISSSNYSPDRGAIIFRIIPEVGDYSAKVPR